MRRRALFLLAIVGIALIILQQLRIDRLRRHLTELPHSQRPPTISRPPLETGKIPPARALDWRALESEDYRAYIKNLRSVGCPEQTIRDIVIADLDRTYAARISQLTLAQKKNESFWRASHHPSAVQYRAEVYRLEEEKRASVRELLGIDLDEEMSLRKTLVNEAEVEFAFLSPERRRQVGEIHRKYEGLWREAANKKDAGLLDEAGYRGQLSQIEQAREAEIANLLGPGELEEYQMRRGELGNRLRKHLEAFEPSESEFRSIFRIEKEFSANHPVGGIVDSGRERQRQEALSAALGKERHAEYRKKTDYDYWNLYKIIQDQNLPAEVADRVYGLQSVAEAKANQFKNNPAISEEARILGLKAIRDETEREMVSQLGEPGYIRHMGRAHFWLDRISPKETAP